MFLSGVLRRILVCLLAVFAAAGPSRADFLSRKQAKHSPRGRIACLPSPTMGTRYMDADDLGKHSYGFTLWEKNGIVYTCHGGHIDVTHLRKVADWTAYLAYRFRDIMLRDQAEMSYRMWEPSRYHVKVEYPAGWKYLPAESKNAIAREVAIDLAAYLGYTASIWHEVLTWHGFKGAGIYPEYNSAFSWEDNYSNAMGSTIAALALRDRDRDYDEAVTRYLDQEIRILGGQPKEAARQAGEAVRGLWFEGGYVIVTMIKRHLDVGLDDGYITPWLVPGVAKCPDEEPKLWPVPDLGTVEKHGFHVTVQIEPKEWERGAILKKAFPNEKNRPDRIDPTKQLGLIIEAIRAEAFDRYGPMADKYEDPTKPHAENSIQRAEAGRGTGEPPEGTSSDHVVDTVKSAHGG